MKFLFPNLKLQQLPMMGAITLLGGFLGGVYGIIHDSITFRIGPEYFTRFKFNQFAWAEFGLSAPLFAAEIGFIASGVVGLFVGWFIARTIVPSVPAHLIFTRTWQAFGVVFSFAGLAFGIGYLLGRWDPEGYPHWIDLCLSLSVSDVSGFVRVAYIHNASYIGGVTGLFAAITLLKRSMKRTPRPQSESGKREAITERSNSGS